MIGLMGVDKVAQYAASMGLGTIEECKAIIESGGVGITDAMRQRAQQLKLANHDKFKEGEQRFNAFFGR